MKYKIGDFSKITKISNRMLRYLDQENLLKPSFVSENGYRYYSEVEVDKAAMIMYLRKYLFSYSEIKSILEQQQELDYQVFRRKLSSLKLVASNYDKLIIELEKDYAKNESISASKNINPYDIQFMSQGSFHALENKRTIKTGDIDQFIEENINKIQENRVSMFGHYFVTFFEEMISELDRLDQNLSEQNQSEQDTLNLGFYQPVEQAINIDGFKNREFEPSTRITTMHFGSYDLIHIGYQALYQWAQDKGYEITGYFSEKYYVDAYFTSKHQEYVTEISVMVIKRD